VRRVTSYHVPRAYHSISSVLLGMRCPRAWAYRYIAGLREPEHAWNDPKAPPRSRSSALGKAVHGVYEAWQRGNAPDWRDLPGQIALSGAHHVPHPDRVHEARVEAAIGTVPVGVEGDAVRWAYELHGILWGGFRDLVVSAPGEFIRLKIAAHDGWALYDYKSTANIERYSLSAAELAVDPQASLYAAATCDELHLDEIPARWLYVETKKVRRAKPVDAVIRACDAKERISSYAETARELDRITEVEAAAMNTAACGEYGGCYYHVSQGGPCNARRSVGALIQARVKKDTNMALAPAAKAAFDTFKNGAAKALPSEPMTNVTADERQMEAPVEPDCEVNAGPNPPAPVVLAMTGTPKRATRKASPVAGGASERLSALVAELAQHEAEAAAAAANIARVVAAIREACG
jgi:RecB family exonuclease